MTMLFTQNSVLGNQLRRQDEEIKSLKDKAEACERQEKEHVFGGGEDEDSASGDGDSREGDTEEEEDIV